MNCLQKRYISFQSLKSIFKSTKPTPATELQKPLTSLPNATGLGAFVEPISYQVLGSASNLLNIKLPRSSILNIRYSNKQHKIVAMNGHINSMYNEIAKFKENNLIFQRCFNQKEPMSLLIASNAQNSNFAVVNCKNDDLKWYVKKTSLFAWSGFSIKPEFFNRSSNIVSIEGEGSFVLSSPGQVNQITLLQGETIHINSNSLIAYNSNNTILTESVLELNSGVKSVVNLGLPRVLITQRLSWIANYFSLPKSFWEDKTIRSIHKWYETFANGITRSIKFVYHKLFTRNTGYFIEVQGPRTLFVTNAVHIEDHILTKEELRKLML